jgi:hypothetical protein
MADERTPRYDPPDRDKKAIAEVRKCIEEGKRWHNDFAKKVERRYDAWRGLLPENQPAPKGWRSMQHPPYLINIVEGMLSNLEEATTNWLVKPRALPGMTPEEALFASDGAEISSYLLGHQMRVDGFNEKAGPLAHQDLVAGLTVGKVYWLKKNVSRKRYEEGPPELIYDEAGGTIDLANKLDEVEDIVTVRDDPTLEVRDVRDWMYPESATSLESAPWVIDRTYVTYKTLERLEELGVYQNVKYVKETRMDESNAPSDPVKDREMRLRRADRTRGLVEIVELWTDDKVVTLANGAVLMRNVKNPFWHGRKPFVVGSAIPDLFQIPGVSVIEGLASLQEMLWTFQNLRIDATRIAASVITLIRGDVEDPGQYEYAPEAQWIVPDPNAVKPLDLSAVASAAQATLQSEGLTRGDIQSIMGGLPFTGGAQSQTQNVDTATGVSIITNIAQAILARRKVQHQRMFGKAGQLFLELDQQFMSHDESRLVEVLGEGGSRNYLAVAGQDIQGVWDVEVEITGESMMREQKRAENQALLQMALQGAGVSAQMGVKLNIRRFWELVLGAHEITDKATFFLEMPAAAPDQSGAPGAGTPQQTEGILDKMAGAAPGGGITNESLAAGPSSPSSPVSMSPAAPMQRSLARVGAGRSA